MRRDIDEVNAALAELESPRLLSHDNPEEILQLGVGPCRIEALRNLEEVFYPKPGAVASTAPMVRSSPTGSGSTA